MAKVVTFKASQPDFTIEKGVPMNKKGRSLKYPFGKMQVGESFFVGSDPAIAQRVRSAACVYANRHKLKFSIFKNDDGEYRCWRVK